MLLRVDASAAYPTAGSWTDHDRGDSALPRGVGDMDHQQVGGPSGAQNADLDRRLQRPLLRVGGGCRAVHGERQSLWPVDDVHLKGGPC
jgi:hypothetical protein